VPEPTSPSAVTEADLKAVKSDWTHSRYRRHHRRF
jgi:hypothetical protein